MSKPFSARAGASPTAGGATSALEIVPAGRSPPELVTGPLSTPVTGAESGPSGPSPGVAGTAKSTPGGATATPPTRSSGVDDEGPPDVPAGAGPPMAAGGSMEMPVAGTMAAALSVSAP